MFLGINRLWFRRLSSIGLIGLTTITIKGLITKLNDKIPEDDEFSIYTNEQQKLNFFSGMHQPFLTNDIQQLNLFRKHFSEYEFLIETNVNEIKRKHSLKSPVEMKSFEELKNEIVYENTSTLIVGGPPAFISGIEFIKKEKNSIYLNDSRRIPIANGSAWHLENDAQTEAPTNYKPTKFLWEQIKRLVLQNVSLKNISETGEFPWRTIDWIGWISHPDHWFRALKLSFQFQLFILFNDRTKILNDVAQQCFINERFFQELNQILNNKLLFKEHGSIIIARNQQEVNELNQLNQNLIKEGRYLNILSKQDIFNRYAFIPNGMAFAEKPHDTVLNPNFINILKEYFVKQGGTVIDGTLNRIYINEKEKEGGGIASFTNLNGEQKFIKFSRLILSLGNQQIFNSNGKRLFDVVSARGVSMLAHVYLPKGFKVPPVLVCGGTNHLTKLSSKPISINENQDLYLMRLTGGACITPNISNEYTSYYDGTIAIGLIQSVRKSLGIQCQVKPILVYGCNRQVSQYGQIKWIQPSKNIFIQYGAAGGGLTRAPDFITTFYKNNQI